MTTSSIATAINCGPCFFRLRFSNNRNGTTKWNRNRMTNTGIQPLRTRAAYHGTSSLRLPDQIMMNCENDKYVYSMTKASNSLPLSCNSVLRSSDFIGSYFAIVTSTMMLNDIASNAWPAM